MGETDFSRAFEELSGMSDETFGRIKEAYRSPYVENTIAGAAEAF